MKIKLPRSKAARAIPPNRVIPDKREDLKKKIDQRAMWNAASRLI